MKTLGAITLASLSMLLPAVALAHAGGHGLSGWSAGMLHPLLGLDHLLALVAAGFWLAQQELRNQLWLGAIVSGLFVTGIVIGSWGQNIQLESGVVVTLMILGTLVACAVKVRLLAGIIVLGAAALIHGFVHGTELSIYASDAAGFTTGLLISSTAVLILSRTLVDRAVCHVASVRLTGMVIAIFGAFLAF